MKNPAQEDILAVMEVASPALALLFNLGTAGSIPSLILSAVLRHLVEELRNYAVTKDVDMKMWDDTEKVIFDGMDSTVLEMPKDTVFQKGGSA